MRHAGIQARPVRQRHERSVRSCPRRTLGVERVSIADPRDAGMLDVLLAPSGMSNALEPGAGAVERPL